MAPTERDEPESAGVRKALILVGLPGDAEHRELFAQVTAKWKKWLTAELQFAEENVIVLEGRSESVLPNHAAGTRDGLKQRAGRLVEQSRPEDGLWVFFIGHANYDEEHVYFHLPGPDIHEGEVAEMFEALGCREQVFWLTNTCSGWFLKSLSKQGRIVITASAADREFNETEFPAALADVAQLPLESLDKDEDGRTSVAELFAKTVEQVEGIFKADERAPTEHAQLDDNGDGAGTEAKDLQLKEPPPGEEGAPPPVARRVKLPDGKLSAATFLRRNPPLIKKDDSDAKEDQQSSADPLPQATNQEPR